MPSPLNETSCARLSKEALPLLARLRIEPGVQAALTDAHAWIRWDAGNDDVVRAVLPIHGAELYRFHEGRWHRFDQTLPAFDMPAELDYQPLAHVLFPAAVLPIALTSASAWGRAAAVTLQRDDHPRKTTALLCEIATLAAWGDTVPTARLASLRAVYHGEQVLILGDDLPLLPASERFWGRDVLIPLGYAPEPALPESALKQAAGLADDSVLLWQPSGAEVIERALLSPMTRAGLRLAPASRRRQPPDA